MEGLGRNFVELPTGLPSGMKVLTKGRLAVLTQHSERCWVTTVLHYQSLVLHERLNGIPQECLPDRETTVYVRINQRIVLVPEGYGVRPK